MKTRWRFATAKVRPSYPSFFCTECGQRVDAHRDGPGSPAHFEHRVRNPNCSLSDIAKGNKKAQGTANCISTAELAERTAGGDSYIRTKDGVVVGLALTQKYNPRAPEIVVVGDGPRIVDRAKLFLQSGLSVPTYLKRGTNAWELIGQYRALAYKTDSATIEQFRDGRPLSEVSGILFLERSDEVDVSVRGGGFASPETRKAIEIAAIGFVTKHYERLGYSVHDRQLDNLGYDLLAVKNSLELKLEVKGTDAAIPRFFLTRNGFRCAVRDPAWRLAVVSAARLDPQLKVMRFGEIERTYTMDPLAWECLPR